MITEKLFTTSDGVDIYPKDKYWSIGGGGKIISFIAGNIIPQFLTFSTKGATEKYVKQKLK